MIKFNHIHTMKKIRLTILLIILQLLIIGCSKPINKVDDFKIIYNFSFLEKNMKAKEIDDINYVEGSVKNISNEDKKDIKIIFYINFKGDKKIKAAEVKIDELKKDDTFRFKVDTTEEINKADKKDLKNDNLVDLVIE